jgi:hypothetical protein
MIGLQTNGDLEETGEDELFASFPFKGIQERETFPLDGGIQPSNRGRKALQDLSSRRRLWVPGSPAKRSMRNQMSLQTRKIH